MLVQHALADLESFVTALRTDSAELLVQYLMPSDTMKLGGVKGIKMQLEGEKKMKEKMGMQLSNFAFYPPTSMIHQDSTVQCALSYMMNVDIGAMSIHQKQERVVIGVSFNAGLHWHFIEVSEGGPSVLPGVRKLYPILSPNLVIPKARE